MTVVWTVIAIAGVACSSSTASTPHRPPATPSIGGSTTSPDQSPPAPSASPAEAVAPPATMPVVFSGLPPGVYPTHLHSVCNGSQAFHIVVLQNLTVGSGGSGSIQVPSGYFGQGHCVIVYTSPSLASVAATQTI